MKSPDLSTTPTAGLLSLVELLKSQNVVLKLIDNPALNGGTPRAKTTLTIITARSQFEQKLIRDWKVEVLVVTKPKKGYGQVPKFSSAQIKETRHRGTADVPKAKANQYLSVSRQTPTAVLSDSGRFALLLLSCQHNN
ncbi:recombinase family protein [Mycetocola lacteus]|uniref:Recombinase family protein n=1 Tax=Mycetocola lacteus TaxID=76637 RepID=A0A3L7AJ43_9MICO|nr:recombinase family protein [Mycetocola lacteus]RLP80237.1 recombinase family protein [Mycetocola lacteus]